MAGNAYLHTGGVLNRRLGGGHTFDNNIDVIITNLNTSDLVYGARRKERFLVHPNQTQRSVEIGLHCESNPVHLGTNATRPP